MGVVRIYRMTIASTWYNKQAECAQEHELHFKVARRGPIRSVRRYLAKRGLRIFQSRVYNVTKKWIPKGRIRVSFEREQPTLLAKSERIIQVEARRMEGVGKRWKAYLLPSRMLSYVKKKHS